MAAKAPKVQTLSQAMRDLNPAYAASNKIVNQQIGNLKTTEAANIAGLDAAKGQGFNAINNQATGRGGSFSGIPVDEQATYLSTKYLPGIQQAQADTRDNTLRLQGQIADNNKELRTNALGRIDKQKSDLNSWNMAQAQLQAQAKQAALDRAQELKITQMKINADAASAAATRAATASAQPSADAQIRALLMGAADKGGNVSDSVWASAAAMAYDNGIKFGGKNGFASRYWQFADDSNWKKYKLGYDRYM